jgi:hypothetical protein
VDEFLEAIARAIRRQSEGGRSYGQLAAELNVNRRTIGFIVKGQRGIGLQTLLTIMEADPPWLREVLAGAPPWVGGRPGPLPPRRPN